MPIRVPHLPESYFIEIRTSYIKYFARLPTLNTKKEMSTLYFSFFKQILQNWILLSFTQDALIKLTQNVIQQKKKKKAIQAFFSNC